MKSLLKEIEFFSDILSKRKIISIFFGGGTPSLMPISIVDAVINKISSISNIDSNTEITIEVNPTAFEVNKFKDLYSIGINRISIGVQSFNDKSLKKLGRVHNVNDSINAINTAKKIFNNISCDLIYARDGQSFNQWKGELEKILKLQTDHLSLYQLTIEKGTLYYKLYNNKKLILPSNALAKRMYDWTNEYLFQHGLFRYEISSYATYNKECIHNMNYWKYNNYIGVGPGAHSRINNLQGIDIEKFKILKNDDMRENKIFSIMMLHKPNNWLSSVKTFGQGIQTINLLSITDMITEILIMGLRLKNGININEILKNYNIDLFEYIHDKNLQLFINLKLIEINNGFIKLTYEGLAFHNYILQRLLKF